ncbi:hypothetical protein MESS2_390004 [Mesorhizobium metallidurans STM 2683]|uniref:Uncharacterized protein n=1 Tax=Mesorhizobium metallidurans STM 2683 TaxID=1297569 RepID=M5F4J2_9HYPH|nr:hypothetical protein MESS2_390004 [Mesorhizobium metallidurans STM 2683]
MPISFLLPNDIDSSFSQDRCCNPFKQYAYQKISTCPRFMQYLLLIDLAALLRRLGGFAGLSRHFCRTSQAENGTRFAF